MVEGPKYKRHAELLAAALVGQKLRAVLRAASEVSPALAALVGCVVLRVFAVGKELFVVFGVHWKPQSEGSAIRIHFGHGGGYVVEPQDGDAWGPKAAGGGRRREQHAQLQLRFEGPSHMGTIGGVAVSSCTMSKSGFGDADILTSNSGSTKPLIAILRLLLWDELGSSYNVVPPEYIWAAEARAAFDINAAEGDFAMDDAIRLFSLSEEFVVDLIMDQARLPGVGNIIKCEGLFEAGIHPLRRASELSETQWKRLLHKLRVFSDLWYKHCLGSQSGQLMGCCHLMRVYGHHSCVACGGVVSLIKEGTRQRITYFCSTCQPSGRAELTQRPHRREFTLFLRPCDCGDPPALLQVRAGNYWGASDDRRPYLSCRRRRGSAYDDGGCGVLGDWNGCCLCTWLDEVTELPCCYCGCPALLRRVIGLRENGRYFIRCAMRQCRYRCWLRLECDSSNNPDPTAQTTETTEVVDELSVVVAGVQNRAVEKLAPSRWQRRRELRELATFPFGGRGHALSESGPMHREAADGEISSSAPQTSGSEEDAPAPPARPPLHQPVAAASRKPKRWAKPSTPIVR